MPLGYVDDVVLVVATKTFGEMHTQLRKLMEWVGDGFAWVSKHNSKFETSESIVMDFTRSRSAAHPPLVLQWSVIKAQEAHKFLGVMMDQELWWSQKRIYNIAKVMKWVLAFRHLARPTTAISLYLMRQLYWAVAILKMTYAADVWFTPAYQLKGQRRSCGSISFSKKMTSV